LNIMSTNSYTMTSSYSSVMTEIIKRQTNYSDDEIQEKLKLHDNNIEAIILEYVSSSRKKGSTNITETREISTNQKIFKAIRENFDASVPRGKNIS